MNTNRAIYYGALSALGIDDPQGLARALDDATRIDLEVGVVVAMLRRTRGAAPALAWLRSRRAQDAARPGLWRRTLVLFGIATLAACGGSAFESGASDDGGPAADAPSPDAGHASSADASDAGADAPVGHDAQPGDAQSDAKLDAPADAASIAAWSIRYQIPASVYGTSFDRDASVPVGAYTGMCNSLVETATVVASGPDYIVTPISGCYEDAGDPCIFCSGVGQCPSGTPVLLSAAGSTWTGTCGLYTVTLRGQ